MGEVTGYRKKHWTGLDADLASVPSPALGDTYLATDKNKLYYKTSAGWKTGLGYEFVSRSVAAPDFDETDFTHDSAWHVDGLDLSGIVPAGAVAVRIRGYVKSTAANTTFQIRQNAGANAENLFILTATIAGQNVFWGDGVGIDANRLLDYLSALAGVTGTTRLSKLFITGWYI